MIQSPNQLAQPRLFPACQPHASDVERRIEQLVQILADIDFAMAIEVEKLAGRQKDDEPVSDRIATLKEAHRQRRDPYAQRLAELRARTTGLSAARHAGLFLNAAGAGRVGR